MTDPWILSYDGFDPAEQGFREALCALGNGRFVTRGAATEASAGAVHYPGTYVAGGYDDLTSEVAGRTVINEDLVNFPNWLPLTFRPEEGDWLGPQRDGELLAYRQELRLRDGLLFRRSARAGPEGRETTVEARRIVSMACPHLAAIDYRITPENWDGALRIRSGLDGSVRNAGVARYRQLANRHLEVSGPGRHVPRGRLPVRAHPPLRFEVGEAARTRVFRGAPAVEVERRILDEEDPDRIGEELRVEAAAGETLRWRRPWPCSPPTTGHRGARPAPPGRRPGSPPDFAGLLTAHRRRGRRSGAATTWRWAGTRRCGRSCSAASSPSASTSSTCSRPPRPNTVGLDVGAPARGLHGEAYRGHVFWDELFVLPFYNLRQPPITRSLLLYRYHRLDAARQLAARSRVRGRHVPLAERPRRAARPRRSST